MSNNEDPNLMSHNYDGIQELDNPMPSWWLITFFCTIIFATLYFFHYQVSHLSSSDKELSQGMKAITSMQTKAKSVAQKEQPKDLDSLVNDKKTLAAGAANFKANCVSCHGDHGQGLIGPNLTDKYWLHGKGSVKDILLTVENGVTQKGMPAWGPILGPKKIVTLAAFVKSIQGTKPANPKAPQGDKVE